MLEICLKYNKYGLGVKLGLELLKDKLYDNDDKEEIKKNYKKCLHKLTNIDLGIDEKITNKDDIKVLLLDEEITESTIEKYNKILSYGLSVEIITNEIKSEQSDLIKIVNLNDSVSINELKQNGWYNSNNDGNVSLFDKAVYYAFKNKYKYVWFINDDVQFTADDRLNKLLAYESTDDLITTHLSEENEDMQELFDEDLMNTISIDDADWMSTMNSICRVSYNLLGRLNEYKIKNKKMINNEFLLPTICNKHEEMMISYFYELVLPVKVQKRENFNLNDIENEVLNNTSTYFFNISIYCKYESETKDIRQFHTLSLSNKANSSILDYTGSNQVRIFIDSDIELSNSDKKLVKALEKKNIIIDRTVKEETEEKKGNTIYSLIYTTENYICMSMLLKDILEKFAHSTQRLQFLENLLEGEEIVILGGGPSTAMLSDSELKYIIDNYITISVKYVIDLLNNKKLHPTFHVFNQYLASGSLDHFIERSEPYTTIFGSDGSFEHNTALMVVEVKDEHFCIRNFKKLLENHVDCLTWQRDENNNRSYINLHIMCQLALPI